MNKIVVCCFLFFSFTFFYAKSESDDPIFEISPEIEANLGTDVTFADIDNSPNKQFALDNNTPAFYIDLSGFIKINHIDYKSIIYGPFALIETDLSLTKYAITDGKIYFFPKEFSGLGLAGFKVGFEVNKNLLKGSSIYALFPFLINFNTNDKDQEAERPAGFNEADFFTFFYIGGGFGIEADFKLNSYFSRFKINDMFLSGVEPVPSGNRTTSSLYLKNTLNLSAEIAPFNFINKNINIYFSLEERFIIEKSFYSRAFQSRTTGGVYWKPFSQFKLTVNPVKFYYSLNRGHESGSLYDQKSRIEGEASFQLSHKNMQFELGVSPVYWAMKRLDFNLDELKTVTVFSEITFKF